MDFAFTDEQEAAAGLTAAILAERCPPAVLGSLERAEDRLARDAWRALGTAGLLSLALPVVDGGSGLGALDAAVVAEQVGRHVALVPYWASTTAAMTLARWGAASLRARWLPGAATGAVPLTVALWEPGASGTTAAWAAMRPETVAVADGDGWRLDGALSPVPWARHAGAVVVPATVDGDRVALFVVTPSGPGVTVTDEEVLSREPHHTLVLDGTRVPAGRVLASGDDGAAALTWCRRRCTVLLCATALGVCEGALALTARHVSGREQFGAPIGTFQAVAQRSADAYVDTEGIRLTTWQAAWRLDAGLAADDASSVAAFWAAAGGRRVVHAAQHLHGGIGVDTSYPLHRHFRWAKVLELLIGGETGALLRLGASLAAEPPPTS